MNLVAMDKVDVVASRRFLSIMLVELYTAENKKLGRIFK